MVKSNKIERKTGWIKMYVIIESKGVSLQCRISGVGTGIP